MMNSGDTDPTFIETNIPWVMRCIGDDRQQSYLLVDYLYRKLDLRSASASSAPATATAGSASARSATRSRRLGKADPDRNGLQRGRGGFLAAD